MKTFLAAAILTALAPTLSFGANSCHDVLSQGPLHLETISKVRTDYVKDLVEKGFENDAYVVDWKVKDPEFQGPMPADGKFVVTRVTPEKRQTWLETVGKDSIGFGVRFDYNPADKSTTFIKTAWLRIGDTFYDYRYIHAGHMIPPILKGNFAVDLNQQTDIFRIGTESGFAESTFKMTPEEIATIKEYVELRHPGLPAKSVITGTKEVLKPDGTVKYKAIPDVQVGAPIRPKFNEEKVGLILEGCAGACTSWMNPLWQAHIDPALAAKLTRIQDKYGLFVTPVARQLIWRNSRNPHVIGLTMIEGKKLEHEDPFIETHSWGNLRGMAIYGTVPDPVGDSVMIDSTRTPLKQWLEKQKE